LCWSGSPGGTPSGLAALFPAGAKGAKVKPSRVLKRLIRSVIEPLSSRFPTPPGEVVGFADGRVHSFRHFFCSLCANSGVPEQMLMSWLGHRSSRMIRRYYHAHDEASKAAMLNVKLKPAGMMPAVAPPVIPQTPAAAAKESA
jgi:integrase